VDGAGMVLISVLTFVGRRVRTAVMPACSNAARVLASSAFGSSLTIV
jgi:hypothetical protein